MFDEISKRVLIVEDDEALRNVLKGALSLKYNVAEASDGVQALERLDFFQPDLILLDLLLPKIDGFELLARIRKASDPKQANTPVVILSNLSGAEDVMKAKNLKADAYFVKANVDLEEVKKKIDKILLMEIKDENMEVMDFTKGF